MSRLRIVGAIAATVAIVCSAAPATATPGPTDAPEYWFDQWQVPALWASGVQGQGVTIAEIDTGVNAALPELHDNVLSGIDFGIPGDGHVDRQDSAFGHGTAMASIMVGKPGILGIEGIAPKAKLLPIAVPLTGTTDADRPDNLGQAIRWAADHGGKVISMSLGGDAFPKPDADPCPADEQAAIYYAIGKGAVVLAAAGNNGPTKNTVEEPGVCLGVVSVGAVDRNGNVPNFSSRHPYLTLTAPGVAIASLSRTLGSAYSGDGTSQATAVASAVVALVWSKYPSLNGRQVVARVLATLDQRRSTRDPAYGYGVVNAFRAVTAPVAVDAPNPVFAAADPFIARVNAFDMSGNVPLPPPAGDPRANLGSVRVTSSPRLHAPQVVDGAYLAAGGLIALLVLGSTSWWRRWRLRRARAAAEKAARHARPFWRDIVAPPRGEPAMYSSAPDQSSED